MQMLTARELNSLCIIFREVYITCPEVRRASPSQQHRAGQGRTVRAASGLQGAQSGSTSKTERDDECCQVLEESHEKKLEGEGNC